MAESPIKTGLLSSIEAVFELNRKDAERKKEKLRNQREIELVHSKYLKSKASLTDLQEAKFVVQKWNKKNSSKRMDAITRKAEQKRHKSNLSGKKSTSKSPLNHQATRKKSKSPQNHQAKGKNCKSPQIHYQTSGMKSNSSNQTHSSKKKSKSPNTQISSIEKSKSPLNSHQSRNNCTLTRDPLSNKRKRTDSDEECGIVNDLCVCVGESEDSDRKVTIHSSRNSGKKKRVHSSHDRTRFLMTNSNVKKDSSIIDLCNDSIDDVILLSDSLTSLTIPSTETSSSLTSLTIPTTETSSSLTSLTIPSTETSSSSLSDSQSNFVSCPILNCYFKTKSRVVFDQHMEKFNHSPLNPWMEMPSTRLESYESMCPECFKVFKTDKACIQHRKDSDHSQDPFYPVPVSAYLCHSCLKLFPSKELCNQHIESTKHKSVTFPFQDDIGKVYLSGVPVSPHFVADYVKLCIETETRVVCSDCELEMKGAKELQQHLDETRLLHHCMALTDLDQTEIFTKYLCTNTCTMCNAMVYDPKANGGFHLCSTDTAGKVAVNGCMSFKALIAGQCIRLKQAESCDLEFYPQAEKVEQGTVCVDINQNIRTCHALSKEVPHNSDIASHRSSSVVSKSVSLKSSSGNDCKNKSSSPEIICEDVIVENECINSHICTNKVTSTASTSKDISQGQSQNQLKVIHKKRKRNEEPCPDFLKEMVNIIFLDIDNWGKFFNSLPKRLPDKTFVWGFYGGKTNWKSPVGVDAYDHLKREGLFYLHDQCGITKDAADFAIALTVGKMDICLPSEVHFTILSGDKGFCEIERQLKTSSKRNAVVIDPHNANKFSVDALYTMIISVSER